MKKAHLIISAALMLTANAYAGNSTLDAAIGAGVGAAIGNEVGGREGAIVGGAIGAAVGTSGSDSSNHSHSAPRTEVQINTNEAGHPGYHCPPGQAKKGRC